MGQHSYRLSQAPVLLGPGRRSVNWVASISLYLDPIPIVKRSLATIAALALRYITTTADRRGESSVSTKRVSALAVYERDWHAFEVHTCIYHPFSAGSLSGYLGSSLSVVFLCSSVPLFFCDYRALFSMTIPVYRHNLDHDDWEVASVYDSDGCGSMVGSAYNESPHSSPSLDDPALCMEGDLYDDNRPRFVNGYPVPQQLHQNYPPVALARPRLNARYVPGEQSSFVIPPPGVIFPPKDWVPAPQDMYWPTTTHQMASSSDMPVGVGLIETPSPPPPPSLLLSPSSPPRSPSPLIKRPSPTTTIAHNQRPHATSVTMSGTGTGANIKGHASPIMPPPPQYHEVARVISPRLADAGCQAHSSMAMGPPRRSGHDALSPYAPGPGHFPIPRGPRSGEEFTPADGRYGGGGPSGHPSYGLGDRPDIYPPPVPNKHEEPGDEHDGGRTRTARPRMRERQPSVWKRFVRRFSPSHVSVGQT